jgi:transposase-like protein
MTMASRPAQRFAAPEVSLCQAMVNRAARRRQDCRTQAAKLRNISAPARAAFEPGPANMQKGDLICPKCGAGFRRITPSSLSGERGEFRCTICDLVLEVFDGSGVVAHRLTVAPSRIFA